MNKKIKLFTISTLTLSALALVGCKSNKGPVYYVDFFNNYAREEFTLSDEFVGRGNNIIYQTVEVTPNTKVTKPEDPTRKNYDFVGWFKEKECEHNFDFDALITGNTKAYAKWTYSGKDEIVEPSYTPPSTVLPDSAATDYVIDSIMYSPVYYNQVKSTTAGINKLNANKDNVLPLMEYRVKNGKDITATYADNKITVTCNGNVQQITVKDDSGNYSLNNSTYETKAKKYEANAAVEDSYHVMLAGSSSIEFWENSKEDLDPIVSFNHGIGGTTIEEWDTKLNQRLVLPYKPKMVVYYVGINNVINSKQSADTIKTNIEKFFNDTHAALPNTKVQYILMNLIPGFPAYYDTINSVNDFIKSYQASNSSWLTLINPGDALLKENGEPNAAYFRTDGLHLSHYGYIVWGGIIKDSIYEGLKNM